MDTMHAFAKSLLIAPAENALRKAETTKQLEDAWFTWCDGFADDSAERQHLLKVYDKRRMRIFSLRAD